MASGVHCIVTARETDEKINKEIEGKRESVITGKKIPDGFKGMDYNAKTVIRTFSDPETGQICAEVVKDRTRVHKAGDILEDPTLLDWQTVIDKNVDKKEFVLKNDLDKAVETEQEMYEKEAMELHKSLKGDTNAATESSSDDTDIEAIKKEIIAKRNALPPTEKKAMKEKLESAGLPTAYKNVTDIEILNKVLAMFD